MDELNQLWENYQINSLPNVTILSGYTCPDCGWWVSNDGPEHYCWKKTYYGPWTYSFPVENKTEKAFNILKALVKMQVIEKPTSFEKFCEWIEKIASVI